MRLLILHALVPTIGSWAAPSGAGRAWSPPRAAAAMVLLEPERDAALAVPERTNRMLDSFLEIFDGHFDNYAQFRANEAEGLTPRHGGGHEHIHCVLRHVPLLGASEGDGANGVLASYYFNGDPTAVFRERLYAFEAVASDAQFGACVRMAIYKLRDPVTAQLRAAGGLSGYSADDVAFSVAADLSPSQRVEGADVYWRLCGERFEGRMRTESITVVSERTGDEIVVSDDVALWEEALWVNDRGHDAATGEYVYGNVHGVPYKMARVDEAHWTSTGAPPPSS